MRKTALTILLALSALVSSAYPRPCPHPRLLLHSGEEVQIRAAIASQPVMASADSALMAYCDEVLSLPPHEKKMAGFRIYKMQEPLRRIFALAYAYRVHGDRKYADRAIREMMTVADYDNWNPGHYLDVAEITMGMAIGYDWLYDVLTPAERETVAAAIKKHGFDSSYDDKSAWFYTAFQNWNQVCNAGLVYGAIALWDEYHTDAVNMLDNCFGSNYLTLQEGYSEEGAYAEGYGYWGYGSAFQIMLVAALESAFGSDLGLMDGYSKFYRSGRFMQMMNRPTGLCFNYADSGRKASAEHIMAWLAKKTGDYSLLYLELEKLKKNRFSDMDMQRLLPFFLICGRDIDFSNIPEPSENVYVAGGLTPLYIYRSGWNSPNDVYLGVKAGLASSNHSHSDTGSFVFDADGVTWADDLGAQNYLSLESKGVNLWNRWQNSGRYDVFRISPFTHNIITVNGHKPDVYQYVDFKQVYDRLYRGVVMDLKMPYWEDLKAYERHIWLEGKKDPTLVVMEDLKGGENPAEVRWCMCTMADAEIIDNQTIRLSKNGHVRLLVMDGPKKGEASIWSAQPQTDYDYPNPDNSLVGFSFILNANERTIVRIRLIKEK